MLSRASSSLICASFRSREPFNRAADTPRGPEHQYDFRIDRAAQAVRAADVAGDQPKLGLGNLHRRLGDGIAKQPRPLEAAMQRVAAGAAVVFAGDAARLSVLAVTRLMTRRCSMTWAALAKAASVARGRRPGKIRLRRARLECLARRYHRRPRHVVDLDDVGGVAGRLPACRRPRSPPGSHAARGRPRSPAGAAGTSGRRRVFCTAPSTASPIALLVILAGGQHRMHAGHLNAARVSMPLMSACACGDRTIAAWNWSGEFEVVEVASAPHQQARVLAPPHRLTDRRSARIPSAIAETAVVFRADIDAGDGKCGPLRSRWAWD